MTDPDDPSWLTRRTGLVPTTAPATRHSELSVLDEASRPVAAEPPPEVTFSRRGIAVGSHLLDVHNHYRQEMQQVRDILEQVRVGTAQIGDARSEINLMTIRANDWTLGGYCQAQCVALTQHHSMESDGIFPHLRRSQADLAGVIDRLDTEHRAIHELLESVDAALVHLARNPTDYGPITTTVDLLTDTLHSHFAYEESQLMAPLARFGFYPGQT